MIIWRERREKVRRQAGNDHLERKERRRGGRREMIIWRERRKKARRQAGNDHLKRKERECEEPGWK